jgi:hypothetical protein
MEFRKSIDGEEYHQIESSSSSSELSQHSEPKYRQVDSLPLDESFSKLKKLVTLAGITRYYVIPQ